MLLEGTMDFIIIIIINNKGISTRILHDHCAILTQFGIADLYTMPPSSGENRKIRYSEGLSLFLWV